MKKVLMLAGILLAFVVQANAACYLLTVRNNTNCVLYYSAYTYTPPTCSTMNGTNTIQILPGATHAICVGDPSYSWSPATPNGVTDRWEFAKVYTDPNSACPFQGVNVGETSCGFAPAAVLTPSQANGCPYGACPTVNVTWSFVAPFHWYLNLN